MRSWITNKKKFEKKEKKRIQRKKNNIHTKLSSKRDISLVKSKTEI